MIESFGQRPTALAGTAAATPADPAREKIVHRPPERVNAIEKVDKNAQVGPRPTFRVTYLERAAALWPEEPDPPVTSVAYEAPEGGNERSPSDEGRPGDNQPAPKIDIRR